MRVKRGTRGLMFWAVGIIGTLLIAQFVFAVVDNLPRLIEELK